MQAKTFLQITENLGFQGQSIEIFGEKILNA